MAALQLETVNFKDESTDDDYTVIEILLEYGGRTLLTLREGTGIKGVDLLHMVFQSALGMHAAHKLGIFHADIKPHNMVFKEGQLRIIDFDVSAKFTSETVVKAYTNTLTSKMAGYTEVYCPPEVKDSEVMRGKAVFAMEKIDVYCWGMTFYQLVSGKSIEELKWELVESNESISDCKKKFICRVEDLVVPGLKKTTCKCLMLLVAQCLEFSPGKRPDFNGILQMLAGHYKELIGELPEMLQAKYLHLIDWAGGTVADSHL